MLSLLSGHRRYAHIHALRGDHLNAPLLGREAVVSEDSVRRNLGKSDEAEGVKWLQDHLDACVLASGNQPIGVGHKYSVLAVLPEREAGEAPWVVTLSCERVPTNTTDRAAAVDQMAGLLRN
jgi:hypothetical protein